MEFQGVLSNQVWTRICVSAPTQDVWSQCDTGSIFIWLLIAAAAAAPEHMTLPVDMLFDLTLCLCIHFSEFIFQNSSQENLEWSVMAQCPILCSPRTGEKECLLSLDLISGHLSFRRSTSQVNCLQFCPQRGFYFAVS